MIPVAEYSNLYRDPNSGAIINKDETNATIARNAYRRHKENNQRLLKLEEDISTIKQLLNQILEK